ncbi:MAG TPA: hypothetical protein VJZ27_16550 [Aggregatilineales bacterium]|nr:hypothetical protein [Aggregatilineales bacterium]
MPIHIEWMDRAHTIVKHTYEEPWTLQEYYELLEENHRIIDKTGHVVDVINDLRQIRQLPDEMIPALHRSIELIHPNEGFKVMVAANTLARILVESVYITMRRDITTIIFANSIEEAIEMILARRTAHETVNSDH